MTDPVRTFSTTPDARRRVPRRNRLISLGVLGLVAACGGGGSPESASEGGRNQVLVILLDAARSDRMGCYGYERGTTPNMDALAEQGAVYVRHYTQGTNTRKSLPTILFSRYFAIPVFPFSAEVPLAKPEDLFRTVDDECTSIPKVFEAAGYRTAGITAHTWTKPDTRFAREFQEWNDLSVEHSSDEYGYPPADIAVDTAIDWIAEHRDEDFFLYLHLMDTHFPHFFGDDARHFLGTDPPEDLSKFYPNGSVRDAHVALTTEEKAYLDALYDGSMLYTDRELGRLFDFLEEETTLLQSGALAIISDHGEALLEKPGVFDHGGVSFDPVGRVPLVLVGRDRVPAGARYEFLTGNVDVLPTLVGCMGLEMPPGKKADGIDLSRHFDGSLPERDFIAIEKGIVHGKLKAIFRDEGEYFFDGDWPRPPRKVWGKMFDLEADPLELESVRGKQLRDWARLGDLYHRNLEPAYRRYATAFTSDPPPGEFSIGAWSFDHDDYSSLVAGEQELAAFLANLEDDDVWVVNHAWPNFYLLGKGAPAPLPLYFRIPNGEYEVDLSMRGALQVTLGEAEPRVLRSDREFSPRSSYPETQDVRLGRIFVTDEEFRVTIEVPEDVEWSYLKAIAFRPLHDDAVQTTDEEQAAAEERLKALGYIGGDEED